MMISKIELKCFKINLMFELFMCLRLELFKLLLIFYSLGVIKKFQIFHSNFLASFLLFNFFLNFHYFFHFFPTKLPS
jgi:hypothetical protein